MRSATGVPISACLSTATICSTLNRFCFTAISFPFPGAIMPETLPQIGIKIGGPTIIHDGSSQHRGVAREERDSSDTRRAGKAARARRTMVRGPKFEVS